MASQAIIAQRLHVDGAAITRQVKQLEAEGLITRRADPKDNRYTLVALSGEGRRLVEALRAKRELFEAVAAKELSEDEIASIMRGLSQVRHNLRAFGRVTADQRPVDDKIR